jgi:hypothetical protein
MIMIITTITITYCTYQFKQQDSQLCLQTDGALHCVARYTSLIDAAQHSNHSPYQYLQ